MAVDWAKSDKVRRVFQQYTGSVTGFICFLSLIFWFLNGCKNVPFSFPCVFAIRLILSR